MAFAANIVTVAEMQLFAGANVGAADADANHTLLQDYAEAYLSAILEFELTIAAFTALKISHPTTANLISEWAARFAGNALIENDMSGYTDGIEAENMIKINWQRMLDIEKALDESKQDFIGV